jgi:hypothetical protein
MTQASFSSLTETRNIQEEARKNYGTGKSSISDYINTIFDTPLKFSSSNRTQIIITRLRKGKIQVTLIKPKK